MIRHNVYKIYIYIFLIVILLLIIFSFDSNKKKEISKCLIKKNKTHQIPIIHNYRFYNITENPFISIVFDFSNLKSGLINDTLIKFLEEISECRFIDIQIIILYDFSLNIFKNKTTQIFFKKKKIETHPFISKDWIKNFFTIFKNIKGKFFFLLDKIMNIQKDQLQKIYNITKGNINNILKLDFPKNESLYLIRTKILKDIIDKEIEFKNIKEIINYIYEENIHLNFIPVAFCPDNYYTSLTYTSMISILDKKNYYTYILFYLIIPSDFSQKNIQLIESLYEQFDYFNITFLQMDNRYERAYTNRYLTKNAFFRLSLGELLPKVNKIIYLDSDTICLKDLSNLYNLNFMGKLFIAKINTFKSFNDFTINTGVLLLNLIGMRKKNVEKKALTLLNNGFKHPIFHDQAIINIYFKKYVGFLPPEYNNFAFNLNIVKQYKKDSGRIYDFDLLYFDSKFPSIIHYRGDPKYKTFNQEDWYYFARKSKYFHKMSHNLSKIFNFSI